MAPSMSSVRRRWGSIILIGFHVVKFLLVSLGKRCWCIGAILCLHGCFFVVFDVNTFATLLAVHVIGVPFANVGKFFAFFRRVFHFVAIDGFAVVGGFAVVTRTMALGSYLGTALLNGKRTFAFFDQRFAGIVTVGLFAGTRPLPFAVVAFAATVFAFAMVFAFAFTVSATMFSSGERG